MPHGRSTRSAARPQGTAASAKAVVTFPIYFRKANSAQWSPLCESLSDFCTACTISEVCKHLAQCSKYFGGADQGACGARPAIERYIENVTTALAEAALLSGRAAQRLPVSMDQARRRRRVSRCCHRLEIFLRSEGLCLGTRQSASPLRIDRSLQSGSAIPWKRRKE